MLFFMTGNGPNNVLRTGMGRTRDTLGAGLTAHVSDSKLHQPSMPSAFQMAANNIQLQLYLVAMLTWGFCTCPVAIWQFSSPWFWLVISVCGNQKPDCRDSHLFFQVALLSAIIVLIIVHFYCLSYWAVVDISSHRGGKKDELCRQKTKQTKKPVNGVNYRFARCTMTLLSLSTAAAVYARKGARVTESNNEGDTSNVHCTSDKFHVGETQSWSCSDARRARQLGWQMEPRAQHTQIYTLQEVVNNEPLVATIRHRHAHAPSPTHWFNIFCNIPDIKY